jgi:hypothetical protein
MKKLKYQLFICLLLAAIVFSCEKKPLERFVPDRMFTPTSITFDGGDTSVTISWPASLFSAGSGVNYTLEISEDTTFQAPATLTLTVDSTFRTVTDDSLKNRTPYFARVKANTTSTSSESGWVESDTHFTLIGVQIFHPVSEANIIDDAVKLEWTPTVGVSKIIFTAANGDTLSVPVSPEENTAGEGIFDGLEASTSYSAEIYAGKKNKGLVNFTTKSKATGNNVIDLRSIKDNPEILFDTLSQIPDGSLVLLKRGLTYTIPSAYTFDKSVSIQSGLGFGTPATLLLSNNFDADGNIDSLHFSDIIIATDGNANYFMNIGNETVIGNLTVNNVTTQGEFNNSFIRLKTGGADIQNLVINNCIIDSFGVASKYALLYANASSSAVIENISIQNSTFSYFYYFVRQDKVTGISLNINNCTFNNMINNGGYFVNYSGTFPTQFTISNSILGSTIDPANANGIKPEGNPSISNTFATSDDVFSANPILGTSSYAGAAADLFADPGKGDFTIKDNSFAGKNNAGDPRWR